MRLLAGDILATDAISKVYIRVDNDKNILLGYDSKMEITELTNGKLSLTLLAGEFFFDVENKLEDDEEMSFNISNTTMAIRGTSGAGKIDGGQGMLSIYTGVGEIEVKNGEEKVVVQVLPRTKATFDTQEEQTTTQPTAVVLGAITEEDIPEVQSYYIVDNNDYKEKLEDEGWEVSNNDGNVVLPETPIVNPEQEKQESISYVGWRQRRDLSWYFDMDDFMNNIGPTPYDPNAQHECDHCGGTYIDESEDKHIHQHECGHYECEVALGLESQHAACEYVVDGQTHYRCEEGHKVCTKCGVCSFKTTLTEYKGRYYCPACYHVNCSHCHETYTLPETAIHSKQINNQNFNDFQTELCGKHYFCEIENDTTRLMEHVVCSNSTNSHHYICDEGHQFCSDCGTCNYVTGVNLTEFNGAYYCDACYNKHCSHCDTDYDLDLREEIKHNFVISNQNFTNFQKQLCGEHYFCEIGNDEAKPCEHEQCPNTSGGVHYVCEANHQFCAGCGTCSHINPMTEYNGNYYCDDCYHVDCPHCGNTYELIDENLHTTLITNEYFTTHTAQLCGQHYLCELGGDNSKVCEHELCPNTSNGSHYVCAENHDVCNGCGTCSYVEGLTYYDGNYYCNDCYYVECQHCHQTYALADADLHNTLIDNTNFPDYNGTLCGQHYFCEIGFEPSKLSNHDECEYDSDGVHHKCDENHAKCKVMGCTYCLIKNSSNTCVICGTYYCSFHAQTYIVMSASNEAICSSCYRSALLGNSDKAFVCCKCDPDDTSDQHCHQYTVFTQKSFNDGLAYKCETCGKVYCLHCRYIYLLHQIDGGYICNFHANNTNTNGYNLDPYFQDYFHHLSP